MEAMGVGSIRLLNYLPMVISSLMLVLMEFSARRMTSIPLVIKLHRRLTPY